VTVAAQEAAEVAALPGPTLVTKKLMDVAD